MLPTSMDQGFALALLHCCGVLVSNAVLEFGSWIQTQSQFR
jgi:hypothetical protein